MGVDESEGVANVWIHGVWLKKNKNEVTQRIVDDGAGMEEQMGLEGEEGEGVETVEMY